MEEITAQEELAFIKKVIEDSRKIVSADGMQFIFWGLIIIVGLAVTYLSITLNWEADLSWFWPALIGFGWIFTIITEGKKARKRRTNTLAGKIMGAVWIGCGVAMTIIGFVGTITGAYKGIYISPLIATVLGIAYLVSGVVMGKKWITMLCIGWWIGAIIMFSWYSIHSLLIMILLMVLFQTIPGIVLYSESKKQLEV